jgi:hypothetical protein
MQVRVEEGRYPTVLVSLSVRVLQHLYYFTYGVPSFSDADYHALHAVYILD